MVSQKKESCIGFIQENSIENIRVVNDGLGFILFYFYFIVLYLEFLFLYLDIGKEDKM